MVRQIFNEITKQNEFTPEAWKKVKIKVFFKKGDVENVGDYRPMCSLPAMYIQAVLDNIVWKIVPTT